jgi:hypothetical protein
MSNTTRTGQDRYFLPPGTNISVEVGRTAVTARVEWPLEVVADGVVTSVLRDVSDLAAAIGHLGLPCRYEASLLDLVAVVLADVSFEPVEPHVTEALNAHATSSGMTPTDLIAAELIIGTLVGRCSLPAWLYDIVRAEALSEVDRVQQKVRPTETPKVDRSSS